MIRKFRVMIFALAGAFVAVAFLLGAGRLFANTLDSSSVPEVVNYQGYLTDAGGVPINGSVTLQFSIWDSASSGTQLWSETHNNVAVSGGYFSVLLGSQGTPLTPGIFSSPNRYLEVTYSGTTFARQQFASVPYALMAQQAITSTYATTATNALSADVAWSHVVVVAKSGGNYTTITDAMNAISPSSTSRYLVMVMPGVYDERVTLKPYVLLKGSGDSNTIIISHANNSSFNDDAAATLLMPAYARISDLTVINDATVNDAVALKILNGNGDTTLSGVSIQTKAVGGGRHIGLYVNSGDPLLTNTHVDVSGGGTFNRGINSVAATPDIHDATVTVTGTQPSGLHISGGAPSVEESDISGSNGTDGNGLTTNGSGGDVHIDRSTIAGDTGASGHSIFSNDNVKFFVGASLLKGTAHAKDVSHITCSQDYNQNYVGLTVDCN